MISKYIETSILAIIQGFFEFIPVSSSAHLILITKINGFYANPNQYIPIEKTKTPDGSPIGNFSCDY